MFHAEKKDKSNKLLVTGPVDSSLNFQIVYLDVVYFMIASTQCRQIVIIIFVALSWLHLKYTLKENVFHLKTYLTIYI